VALAASALVFVAGCGKGLESKLEGKYKGEAKASDKAGETAKKMAEATTSSLSLELKKDKTFTLTMMLPMEGKWELDGTTLTLTADKIMGQTVNDKGKGTTDANKPMKFNVSDDGNTLTMVSDKADAEVAMIFTKEKS